MNESTFNEAKAIRKEVEYLNRELDSIKQCEVKVCRIKGSSKNPLSIQEDNLKEVFIAKYKNKIIELESKFKGL